MYAQKDNISALNNIKYNYDLKYEILYIQIYSIKKKLGYSSFEYLV